MRTESRVMQLLLDGISKKVGAEPWLYDMTVAPRPGEVTVLLGATQAGKTSLMRIMAGLDVPSSGKVCVDGADVEVRTAAVRAPLSTSQPERRKRNLPGVSVETNNGVSDF